MRLAVVLLAALAAAPLAVADVAPDATLPAPAPLLALSRDLLGFGENEFVDECNTSPVDTTAVLSVTTWEARATGGAWTWAARNGTEVPVEELERALLEHQGESWVDRMFNGGHRCGGGFCACASVFATFAGTRSAGCNVCCMSEGTTPFCACNGQYAYASCGCVES